MSRREDCPPSEIPPEDHEALEEAYHAFANHEGCINDRCLERIAEACRAYHRWEKLEEWDNE